MLRCLFAPSILLYVSWQITYPAKLTVFLLGENLPIMPRKVQVAKTLDDAYALSVLKSEAVSEWKKLSRQVFRRDEFKCIRCQSHYNLTAHHMVSRVDGGADSLANLVTLCGRCHDFVEEKGCATRTEIIGSWPEDTDIVRKEPDSSPNSLYEGKPYVIDELKEIAVKLVGLSPDLLEKRLAYGWWPPYLAVRTPPLLTEAGQWV